MKILMKIGIFLAVMLSSLLGLAESKSDKIYEMFNGKDGVSSVSFSKSAIKPFEIFFDDESKKVVYKMEKIRFMSYDQSKGDISTNDVFNRILKEFNGISYFLIDPDEIDCENCKTDWNEDNVRLIGHGNRTTMNEFHIVVIDNNSCLLFSFYGDITIDDINNCTKFSKSAKVNVTM
jgi:hypothetical protein